jgi:hypothetical protein
MKQYQASYCRLSADRTKPPTMTLTRDAEHIDLAYILFCAARPTGYILDAICHYSCLPSPDEVTETYKPPTGEQVRQCRTQSLSRCTSPSGTKPRH